MTKFVVSKNCNYCNICYNQLVKEIIISKSIELINHIGVSNLTVRKLAKYSQISTRPIYYYFKNLDSLFAEISAEVLRKLGEYASKDYTAHEFLNSGVGFVLFAKKLPHYYAILSIREFWPKQTFEESKADTLMRSKAAKADLKIYETMKTFSLGMALVASNYPKKYSLKKIVNLQLELYNKLIA